jgi:hypothetical protein
VLTVTGNLNGAVYRVQVTGDARNPVVGSGPVAALVNAWAGRKVLVTPAGPQVKVDPGDAQSVLALLSARTDVLDAGDAAEET